MLQDDPECTAQIDQDMSLQFSGMKLSHSSSTIAIAAEGVDDHEDSSNALVLDNYFAGEKRRVGTLSTVEGSPVVFAAAHKRIDMHPTPFKLETEQLPAYLPLPCVPPALQQQQQQQQQQQIKLEALTAVPLVSSTVGSGRKLLVICSASDEHNTGEHQENALRTALICDPARGGCLHRPALLPHMEFINSDALSADVPISDLLRVHDFSYLQHLQRKTTTAAALSGAAGDSSHTTAMPEFYAPMGQLDCDTPLQEHSLDAAKRFCGAAMLAVDRIMGPQSRSEKCKVDRVFVVGRPPGHHAGPSGCVPSEYFWRRPDMTSSGFCLLNTVAVAAAYARCQYGRRRIAADRCHSSNSSSSSGGNNGNSSSGGDSGSSGLRVAIVDIDIHHGNGTEEIVRNLSPRRVFLPLPSSWAPVSQQSYKPWLDERDAQEVFFSSIHLYARDQFYPCSGPDSSCTSTSSSSGTNTSSSSSNNNSSNNSSSSCGGSNIVNIALTPLGPGPWDPKARLKLTAAQQQQFCRLASDEFRSKVQQLLLPPLRLFRPQLLLLSAGFDAHVDDMYHFLTESDIHWITAQLCDVNDSCNGYGVISVLEGGYSLATAVKKPRASRSGGSSTTGSTGSTAAASTAQGAAVKDTVGGGRAVGVKEEHLQSEDLINGSGGLGKGGRQRQKKAGAAVASASVSPAAATVAAATAAAPVVSNKALVRTVTAEFPTAEAVVNDHPATIATAAAAAALNDEEFACAGGFAQLPGDGGLVKGVLAHAAAMVGKSKWTMNTRR